MKFLCSHTKVYISHAIWLGIHSLLCAAEDDGRCWVSHVFHLCLCSPTGAVPQTCCHCHGSCLFWPCDRGSHCLQCHHLYSYLQWWNCRWWESGYVALYSLCSTLPGNICGANAVDVLWEDTEMWSLFLCVISVMHLCLWQGVFEVGSGLGYAAGPPLGGFLYAVEYLYCLYYCCTVVSVGVRVWWDLNSSVYTTSDVYSVFTIYSVFTRLVDSSCPSLLWVEQC